MKLLVKQSRWYDYGASADADRVKHGYDRASNRLWREVPLDTNDAHDELYGYDGLHRLKDFDRGALNANKDAISTLAFAQEWALDFLGNWKGFKQDDNGDATWDLNQTRAINKVNEITAISETAGASWADPAYNRAGNMTTIPKPADPTGTFAATYDAWNMLVKLVEGSNTVQENAFDALRRRTVRKSYTGGSLTETRHHYYSAAWQVLEERLGTATTADRHFIWGLRYIDDLILRDRDTTTPADGTLDERLYALQDANWNVTALCNSSGDIQERVCYHAYGTPQFRTPAYANRTSSNYGWETLFAGYRWDTASMLYHVRWRCLSAQLGTWLSRDPVGYRGDGPNLLALVQNAPINFTDAYAQLSQSTVGAHTATDCGGYDWTVKWDVVVPDEQDGFIIQRVTIRQEVRKCGSGAPIKLTSECDVGKDGTVYGVSYLEIWKVVGGLVYHDADQKKPSVEANSDTFAWKGPGEETYGCHTKHGRAIFIPAAKMTFPKSVTRHKVPEADSLWSACMKGFGRLWDSWLGKYGGTKTEKVQERTWRCCKCDTAPEGNEPTIAETSEEDLTKSDKLKSHCAK